MNSIELLKNNLLKSQELKKKLSNDLIFLKSFSNACEKVLNSYENGGRLYIAGNGGSAADAQHLAAEFVSKLAIERAPLPAEALTVDSSVLTAIGNDYGYEYIFSRQISCKLKSEDIFLGITTSGNSKNIINAIIECRKKGIPSVIFTGGNGGDVSSLCDCAVVVPSFSTAIIQEIHILLAHSLCGYVENAIFN
jgi:D-sedoheptulose 7-phosphate isomerase